MPPAPCTTGSTITAASSCAWRGDQLAHVRRPALVEAGVEPVRADARRTRARPARRRTGCASRRPDRTPPSRRTCRRGSRPCTVSSRVRSVRPSARWYCKHILIATSTATEPESAKNTRSRPSGASSTRRCSQADRRLVREPAEHHVRHPPQLLAHRLVQRRMAIAVDRTPPRRHPVDQLAPVGQPQAHALGGDDRQRLGWRRGQRAVGMPHVLAGRAPSSRPSRSGPSPSPRTGRSRACARRTPGRTTCRGCPRTRSPPGCPRRGRPPRGRRCSRRTRRSSAAGSWVVLMRGRLPTAPPAGRVGRSMRFLSARRSQRPTAPNLDDRPARARTTTPGDATPPRQAATVILLRGGARGARGAARQAHPEAASWAACGCSRAEPSTPARAVTTTTRHRAAAIRELREEAGVALEDPSELVKFSRWITPAEVQIRFDTHFFLAALPPGQEPRVDGEECVDLGWFTPRARSTPTRAGRSCSCSRRSSTSNSSLRPSRRSTRCSRTRAGATVEPVQPQVVLEGEVARVLLPGDARLLSTGRRTQALLLRRDHVRDGVDQRQVRERLRVVAEVAPAGGLELLGVEPERRGVGEQPLAQVLGLAVLADLRQRRDQPERADQERALLAAAGRRRSPRCGSAAPGRSRSARRGSPSPSRARARRRAAGSAAAAQQVRGVERVGVVVLAKDAALVDAVLEDVRADLRRRAPAIRSACSLVAAPFGQPRAAIHARPSTSASRRRSGGARRAPPRSPGRAPATPPPRTATWSISTGHRRSGMWSRCLECR